MSIEMTIRDLPILLLPGLTYIHRELGPLTFHGEIGSSLLKFTDENGDLLKLSISGKGYDEFPSVGWFYTEWATDNLYDPVVKLEEAEPRRLRFLNLPPEDCQRRDPKSYWRWCWARMAYEAQIPRSREPLQDWIKAQQLPPPLLSVTHTQAKKTKNLSSSDLLQIAIHKDRPGYRMLIEYVDRFQKHEGRIGAFVNVAGRLEGQSQLTHYADCLVHYGVLQAFAAKSTSIIDTTAHIANMHRAASLAGLDVGLAEPSEETVRRRVRRLRIPETVAAQKGNRAAKRMFKGKEEPVDVTRPFQVVAVDGVRFEHAVVIADDWDMKVPQLKAVFAIDVFSGYVFEPSIFPGPFRPECSIQALTNIMAPARRSDFGTEDDRLDVITGIPDTLLFDNDKALLPPSLVPNLVNLVGTVALTARLSPDDKSMIENFNSYIKNKLKDLPGRILGAGYKPNPDDDPIKEASLTVVAYREIVRHFVRDWNQAAKSRHGGFSPEQIMLIHLRENKARAIDRLDIQRQMGQTPTERVLLTTNGCVYDGIHYRHNARGAETILANNAHRTPASEEIEGSAKVWVWPRVYDGNLDFIDLLDETTGKYERFYSTDRDYTAGLTRWEHHKYQEMMRAGGGGRATRRDKVLTRAETLREIELVAPHLPFRARESASVLVDNEAVRAAAGVLGKSVAPVMPPELALIVGIGGDRREDSPIAPPQPAPKRKRLKQRELPPVRDEAYGSAQIPRSYEEEGEPETDTISTLGDWNFHADDGAEEYDT